MPSIFGLSILYYIAVVLWLVINLTTCKNYRITRLRAGLYAFSIVYAIIGALIGGRFYSFICRITESPAGPSLVAIFGGLVFTPLFIILTVLIEKAIRSAINKQRSKKNCPQLNAVSVRDTLDMLTPGCLVVLALSKLSCHFDKCCYGVPWKWGVYSPYLQTTVFPVQIMEFISILLVLAILIFLRKKQFYRKGMAYPLAVVFYAAFRFGWEFLRYYPDTLRHVFLRMTVWQNACIIVFTVSIISLVVLYKTKPSEPLPKLVNIDRNNKSKRKQK